MGDNTYRRSDATRAGMRIRLIAQERIRAAGHSLRVIPRYGREAAWDIDGHLCRVRHDSRAWDTGRVRIDICALDLPRICLIFVRPEPEEIRIVVRTVAGLATAPSRDITTVTSDGGEVSAWQLDLADIPMSAWPDGWRRRPKAARRPPERRGEPKPEDPYGIEDLFGSDEDPKA